MFDSDYFPIVVLAAFGCMFFVYILFSALCLNYIAPRTGHQGTMVFSEKDFKDGIECAVCLSDLREGEKARILPKCNHGFHMECIDKWLQSHATCPLCRSHVSRQSRKNRKQEPSSTTAMNRNQESSSTTTTTMASESGIQESSSTTTTTMVSELRIQVEDNVEMPNA